VVEGGRDVQKKEIVVNDPLFYSGVRFYQSSYGPNGKVDRLMLVATPSKGGEKRELGLAENETIPSTPTPRFASTNFSRTTRFRTGRSTGNQTNWKIPQPTWW
jgi:cytochrome c biogenesis protein ResB